MNETYYSELQSTLRSYDQKLWQIPSLFFVAVGFLFNISGLATPSLRNFLILLTASLFLWMLILLYTKAHVFHVSIQKKINEFDNRLKDEPIKRIPLTSMTDNELENRIHELEGEYLKDHSSNEGAQFSAIQKFFTMRQVSWWIRNGMLITLLCVLVATLIYQVNPFLDTVGFWRFWETV